MQKKSEILKKCNFSGQVLDSLPPRKPRLYISRVDFFFFEYHEFSFATFDIHLPKTFNSLCWFFRHSLRQASVRVTFLDDISRIFINSKSVMCPREKMLFA